MGRAGRQQKGKSRGWEAGRGVAGVRSGRAQKRQRQQQGGLATAVLGITSLVHPSAQGPNPVYLAFKTSPKEFFAFNVEIFPVKNVEILQ